MKYLVFMLLLLFSIPIINAYDLSNYPDFFMVDVNGKRYLNALIVIGDNAAATDVIGATDIATSLNFFTKNDASVRNSIEAVLASEIKGLEKEKNLIIVGGPCINTAASVIMGYPKICSEGFFKGKGKIKIYENNGKVAMIVAGLNGADTRIAAKVLSDPYYKLSGNELEVAGSSTKDIIISGMP